MENTANKLELTANFLEEKYGDNGYDAIEYAKSLKVQFKINFFKEKPILNKNHTSLEVIEYASKLKEYEEAFAEHEKIVKETKEYNNSIDVVIEQYIRQVALYSVPEQYKNKVYSKAYEYGHSSGFNEVFSKCVSLNEIFQ